MTQYVLQDFVTIPPEMFEYIGIDPFTSTGSLPAVPDHKGKDYQEIEGHL